MTGFKQYFRESRSAIVSREDIANFIDEIKYKKKRKYFQQGTAEMIGSTSHFDDEPEILGTIWTVFRNSAIENHFSVLISFKKEWKKDLRVILASAVHDNERYLEVKNIAKKENIPLPTLDAEFVLQKTKDYVLDIAKDDPEIASLIYGSLNFEEEIELARQCPEIVGILDRNELPLAVLEAALDAGGRRIFVMIKDPPKELRDRYPELARLKRTGLFK